MTRSAFDIIGPSMVGPSSSHTAGAVRIGRMAKSIADSPLKTAAIALHGSFAATGKGHATDCGLVAGLLTMAPDDERIKDAIEIAQQKGLSVSFEAADLGEEFHPNTARLTLHSETGNTHEVIASSVGGGAIEIVRVDNFEVCFNGNLDTLVLWHLDKPGFLAKVTAILACVEANIATIQTSRKRRHTEALTVIEIDAPPPDDVLSVMSRIDGVSEIRCVNKLEY
ncbi:MAG: L-serine ammonia-lyase, iron-sulfur-dependent subunit beta [Chthoniobacterales bacterium]